MEVRAEIGDLTPDEFEFEVILSDEGGQWTMVVAMGVRRLADGRRRWGRSITGS